VSTARRDLLEQRRQTHGDFTDVALVAQATKDIWRAGAGWKNLSPVQREGLEMIAHKIARIICGNPNHLDHYIDIVGYAQRIIERTK
jgi:hypothetical protein